ncbi:MAG: CocE/NonD family hydrolase, partial [Solimonas sp.]
ADIRAAKRAGETAIVLHFQGADPIEDELDFLNVFHAAGLRVMQLTYNSRNRLGDGCFEPTDAGLSKFGRKVIRRMEDLAMAVDLSHAGARTALEATEAATRPLVVTHANARALLDTPRNISDDLIRAVAASGGAIGVCAAPFFLARDKPATLEMLIDHIAYIADLVGIEHVGIGFDFAEEDADDYVYFGYDERYIPMPPWDFPIGIASHAEAGNVASALKARGFSKDEIIGVLGENFLAVFKRIWGCVSIMSSDRDPFRLTLNDEVRTPALFPEEAIRQETTFVAMRDGCRLAAHLHLPPKLPALVIAVRSPYGRARYAEVSMALARRGHVVICQDVRGTGDSEPDSWDFYIHEREDSYDFVDWVAAQGWCDGFIGAMGGSYDGGTQFGMATNAKMTAIMPEVAGLGIAPSHGVRFHMFLNAYSRTVGKGKDKVKV